jgi:adenylate cyclase
MLGQLVPCGGGPPVPLLKPRLVVGRDETCDLPLHLASISGRHCVLALREGYWLVRDLGSKNGTRVNGAPCAAEWLLPNDVLALASHRYTVRYTPPPGQPAPRIVGKPKALPPDFLARKGPAKPPPTEAPAPPEGQVNTRQRLGELVPCGGGDPIPLWKPVLLVGRQGDCDIVLSYRAVSRRHCHLEFADNTWTVRDLNSRHGIRVDGASCQKSVLRPGNILWIAGLRYRVVYDEAGSQRPLAGPGGLFKQSLLEAAGLANWQPREPRNPKGAQQNRRDPADAENSEGGGCA